MEILAKYKAMGFDNRADIFVDGSWRNGRFDDHSRPFRANLHNALYGRDNITSVHFFAEFVVGCRHGNNVRVCHLVFRAEPYACFLCFGKQFVQSLFLEGGFPCIQHGDKFGVVVCSDHLHSVGSHHQGGRKSNVAESDYVDHSHILLLTVILDMYFC